MECNSLLHHYYPQVYAKTCLLCHNPSDTVSHVLNGCMNFCNMYSSHNRMVNHIHQQVSDIHRNWIIITRSSMLKCSTANPMNYTLFWLIANHTSLQLITTTKSFDRWNFLPIWCFHKSMLCYEVVTTTNLRSELINVDTFSSKIIVLIQIGSI